MKKLIAALLMLCLLTPCALADTLYMPDVDEIRVSKFDLQLVNNTYWIVQKGEWDWSARPLRLVCESGGETEDRALEPMEAGSAQTLCYREDLEMLAADRGDDMLKFSIMDGKQELAWDYPLIPSMSTMVALTLKIWYGEGALWYGGSGKFDAPAHLKKTFSNGTTETIPLPDLDGREAWMVLSPAEIEADLAGSDVGYVDYALIR